MAAPKTVVTYDLSGSAREFDFAFDYLSRGFVQVTLIGAERNQLQVGTDYTFVSASRIRTTTIYSPPEYTQIEIRRVTSTTERLVDFQDASILRADDLDLSQLQVLHVAEEAREAATETIGTNNFGHLDARGRRIVNVADPVDLGDVVNRRWYEGDKSGAFAAVALAEAARDKASEWATKTGGPVEGTGYSAKAYANDAGAQRAAAEGYANAANTHRANAVIAENNAKDWAVKPTAVEGTNQSAKTYASQAAASAVTADGHRQAAATSASTADGHRQAAASSASSAANQVVLAAAQVTAAQGQVTLATNQANRSKDEADRASDEADRAYTNAQSVNGPYITAQLKNPTELQSVNGGQIANRNVVVNGAMMLAHEGTQSVTSGSVWAVDCFSATCHLPAGNSIRATRFAIQAGRLPPDAGLVYAARTFAEVWPASPGAGAYAALQTPLEGNNVRRFIGKTFTVSFYVRGNKAGTAYLALRSGKANRAWYKAFTIPAGEAWSRVSITVPGGIPASWHGNSTVTDFSDGLGLQMCWVFHSGSTYRSGAEGTWNTGNYLAPAGTTNYFTTAYDVVDITGVQAELGTVATPYEHESYATTIQKVNRYVYLCDSVALCRLSTNMAWGGAWATVQFPTRMAAIPTITLVKTNGDGAGQPLLSAATFGSAIIASENMAVNEWLACQMLAKAYPT